jgi:16S rRNA (guanine527-N7)-methyltransferase
MQDDGVTSVLVLAEQWEVPLTREGALCLVAYLSELLKWNARVNLTGARALAELVGDHLPDSFALARLCPRDANLVDIGSGGGLPAIPFAMLRPDCRVTLVEPRAKRIAFLNAAARGCSSGSLTVVRARMEELADSGYQVAISRATFDPQEWLVMARRLLSVGGTAVVFAANPVEALSPGARLAKAVTYSTLGGAPRWCASFCFT